MKKQQDFFKIYDLRNLSRLIAVVNLNYMFPIPKDEISPFLKKNIDEYRTFKSEDEKSKYIDLLDLEIKAINKLDILAAAVKLYHKKYEYPNSKIAQRCLDYKDLEIHAIEWAKLDKNKTTVEITLQWLLFIWNYKLICFTPCNCILIRACIVD